MSYKFHCVNCDQEFETVDHRQKFCSRSCVGKWSASKRTAISDEQKEKISSSLKKFYKEHPEAIKRGKEMALLVGAKTKGKYKKPKSICEVSKRTAAKIIRRLNVPCSRCGWDEEICDIHHIYGRKCKDADNHKKLTLLCPNCHRLVHAGKVPIDELITLDEYIGDKWLDAYYG